jgi:hypothetical protein
MKALDLTGHTFGRLASIFLAADVDLHELHHETLTRRDS